MITQEESQAIVDAAIRHGERKKVDGIEVIVTSSNVSTSRFANNSMTQNQSPNRTVVSVRVQKGGRQAKLSSDQIAPKALKALVDNAVLSASFLAPDNSMLPMAQPQKKSAQKSVNRYDPRTAKMTADQRADAIKCMIDIAKERNLVSAGIYASGSWSEVIGNSEGLFRYHKETTAEVSVTMRHGEIATERESTGWAKAHSPKSADIDAAALATRAAEKAAASANPQELPPGKYTVILEPPAVLDLIHFLWYDFTGTSFVDKLSCFLDKLGQPVLGANINIVDNVYHPLQSGAPFGGEGLQRHVVQLVENGAVANLVYGRKSARERGASGTGHGLPEPSAEGEWPFNLVMSGGDKSLDELISSTQRGILLTRVWYVREVDPTSKIVTGMTRDGTFLVENGAIKCGIKNFRFNQSLIEMLNKVSALGVSGRTAGEEGFPAVVPAMKVEDFNFSSVTRF